MTFYFAARLSVSPLPEGGLLRNHRRGVGMKRSALSKFRSQTKNQLGKTHLSRERYANPIL